jgi:hypothetical protein
MLRKTFIAIATTAAIGAAVALAPAVASARGGGGGGHGGGGHGGGGHGGGGHGSRLWYGRRTRYEWWSRLCYGWWSRLWYGWRPRYGWWTCVPRQRTLPRCAFPPWLSWLWVLRWPHLRLQRLRLLAVVSWPLRLRENLGLLIGSLARTEPVGASVAVAGRPRREFRFSVHTGRAYAFDADGGLLLDARRLLAI